jgi:hypothetical protein
MTNAVTRHRLEGLEPDNLLAFLALLGLLQSLEAVDRGEIESSKLRPRVFWDIDAPPLRPVLLVKRPATQNDIGEAANNGISILTTANKFGDRQDLNYTRSEARRMLEKEALAATVSYRHAVDLLAALMSDAAIKDEKGTDGGVVEPTPLCLLFGQGHQHFLERLVRVPREPTPPVRGKGKTALTLSPSACLKEALFAPWHRSDPTSSFRWDPHEDVRHALMAGDPTDSAYKAGTQHGANRLAAAGLRTLTLVPERRAGRICASVLGGSFSHGAFSISWPIWREPATLSAIRALLGHPDLLKAGALAHLGIDHVLTARRISVGKFMNFSRAQVSEA